jgi:integrase
VVSTVGLRVGSRRTYASNLRKYISICRDLGISPFRPISERDLCAVCVYFCRDRKVTGLASFLSAVENWYSSAFDQRLPRGFRYRRILRGLKNLFSAMDERMPAEAISMTQLRLLHDLVDHSSLSGARDWCAILFAFFGLLRSAEYTGGAMKLGDVTPSDWSIRLSIALSKGSLVEAYAVIAARSDMLCPRKAFFHYISLLPLDRRSGRLPLFQEAASVAPLSYSFFNSTLKALVAAAGVPSKHFSTHSLRRGGTTALYLAGVAPDIIQAHGRWISTAWRCYVVFS